MNNRVSSIYPPNTGEYVSPFTAPAMPNVTTLGSAPHKPVVADFVHVPRSPLPPQKLAKLANALGISAPLPAASPSPTATKRYFSALPADERATSEPRSATPSSVGGCPTVSRYLIHVVPPEHFPHESRKDPEAFATFRRGLLVPLHATLQAQVSAIAREFQLPTTHGLVLYLVNDSDSNEDSKSRRGKGPRISHDIWKWLWMKVADEQPMMRGVGLGLSSGASFNAPSERPGMLRKLSMSPQADSFPRAAGPTVYPLTPSSSRSTSASVSAAPMREDSQEEASLLEQSSSSQFSSTSSTPAPDTPATSLDLDPRLLPGLGSTSLMPVLAKVEFDIDRKVGTWYETWSRSRKSMQKRRGKNADPQTRLQLRITINNKKGTISPLSSSSGEEDAGYERLSESPDPIDPEDELTARVSRKGDPLAEVFGSDKELWSDMQSTRLDARANGDLALDGAALSALPDPGDADPSVGVSDKEEVLVLWNAHDQPQLNGGSITRKGIPPPLNLTSHDTNLEINVATATPSPYTAGFGNDSIRLPYLQDSQSSGEDGLYKEKRIGGIYDDVELDLSADIDMEETRANQLRIRQELDVLERNLEQFSPRALKSVELSPELLPPNRPYFRSTPAWTSSFTSSSKSFHAGSPSVQLSPSQRDSKRLVPTIQQLQPVRPSMVEMEDEVVVSPPMFRQPVLVGTPSPDADSFKGTNKLDTANTSMDGGRSSDTRETLQAAWPAVPYTAIARQSEDGPMSPTSSLNLKTKRLTNSPPQLVLNGKINRSSKASSDKRKNSLSVSSVLSSRGSPRNVSESQARSKQYEEEAGLYSETVKLQPSLSRKTGRFGATSPVIPLSPDPFGRFPSSAYEESNDVAVLSEHTSSLAREGANGHRVAKAPSSRFSVDSVADAANVKVNSRSTIMSMKSIRKLWRNRNKASVSGRSSQASPDPSTNPTRPPSSATSTQETETDVSRTPSPSLSTSTARTAPPGSISQASMRSAHDQSSQKQNRPTRPDSGLDPFYLDQDLRLSTRRSPSPQSQYQFPLTTSPAASASLQRTPPTPEYEKKRPGRKSVMKWKNGSDGGSSSQSESTGSRRRRTSIFDLTRGSISSMRALSPSVPSLREEYASGEDGEWTAGWRRKPAPQLSTDSSQESTDAIPTPVSAVAPLSFPKEDML